MQYAYGNKKFTYHQEWGLFSIRINTPMDVDGDGIVDFDQASFEASEASAGEEDRVYFRHGVLMYVSWGALLTV
jgi:hypothetical protein